MEIRQLEYFLAVAEAKSFTQAALLLFVSQPAVTNAIRGLEDELGVRLFDRSAKNAILTTEGQIFQRHVQGVMQGIGKTLEEINAMKNLSSGILRLGITPLGGTQCTGGLIADYLSMYPSIELILEEGNDAALVENLIEDRLDLAILDAPSKSPALTSIALQKEELLLLVSRRDPLHRKNSVKAKDVLDHRFLLFPTGNYREIILEWLGDSYIRSLSVQHISTQKRLVATGHFCAFLPESLAEGENMFTPLYTTPSLYYIPQLTYKTNRYMSTAAAAFLEGATAKRKGAE